MRSLLALLPLLLAASASAQTVAGILSEEGTGRPIDGAVVVLLDPAGPQRGGTLTDEGVGGEAEQVVRGGGR